MCCGTQCRASFANVQFTNCSLVAVHGAEVTLDNCSFSWEGSSESCEIGIFASGSSTSVQVNGGMIRGGKQGAAVSDGARLDANSWKIRKVVSSHGPGSTLLMRTCSFDNVDTSLRSCHALLVKTESIAQLIERPFSVSVTACRAKACLQRGKVRLTEATKQGVAVLGSDKGAAEPEFNECIVSDASREGERMWGGEL